MPKVVKRYGGIKYKMSALLIKDVRLECGEIIKYLVEYKKKRHRTY
jgi:hypothetical protein